MKGSTRPGLKGAETSANIANSEQNYVISILAVNIEKLSIESHENVRNLAY